MKTIVKGLCALLTCGLAVGLFTANATQVVALSILNSPSTAQVETLYVERYSHQPLAGIYLSQDCKMLDTSINTVSMGADLQFTAMSDNVKIYVSVLTDLDDDDLYEWIDSLGATTSYLLSADGTLVEGNAKHQTMTTGEQRTLSASELLRVGMASEQNRIADGVSPLYGITLADSGDLIYCVTIQDENGDTMTYYFKLKYGLDTTVSTSQLGAGVFQDVPSWSWYWDEVDWAVRAGLLKGDSATRFLPDEDTTRAALMQVLYLQAGAPETELAQFSDVSADDWYADAVSWGAELGLVGGYNGKFNPDDALTREELAVIVYKLAGLNGLSTELSASLDVFSDGGTTSDWAETAVCWALSTGILDEQDGGILNPQGSVSRATLASVLMTLDSL